MYQKPQSYEVQFLRYEELKNENLKKIKKAPGDTVILHNCAINNDNNYTVPEIWHVIDVIIIFHFGVFFALLLPQKPKKLNF